MLRRNGKAVRCVIAVSCVLALGASPVAAEAEHEPHDSGKRLELLDKRLGLTDAQQAQMKSILTEYQNRAQSLHEQLESLKRERHDKIKAVLTPDQQQKFDKMKENMHGRGGLRRWRQHHEEHEN